MDRDVAHALAAWLERFEPPRAGSTVGGFAARTAALDDLEGALDDARRAPGAQDAPLRALIARAEALRERLEGLDRGVVSRLRARIASGRYDRVGLGRSLARLARDAASHAGYDALDVLVMGLCAETAPGEARVALEPEMVFYVPTPARAVLDVVARAAIGPEDTFVDVGSGLGQVAILVSLLTGATCRGIELEPAYVAVAKRAAAELRVPAEFVEGDARTAPLGGGTAYFLYTPFRGAILRQVLERLRGEAARRPLRVATLGPCTPEVAAAGWLDPIDARDPSPERIAVFRSRVER